MIFSINCLVLLGIFLFSIWIGRVSPTGFRRDFPLALLLFSQIWIALKLAGEYGYWIGIAFGFAFFNAFIVLLGIFGLKWNPKSLNRRTEKTTFLLFASIFVVVLILSGGISEHTESNMLGFLFGYSLGLVPLFGTLEFLEVSHDTALRILMVSACLYYALIGFMAGENVSWGWGIVTALIFSILFCWGFISSGTNKR
ncbi:hypothetical protein [Thermococcus sp.]